MKDGKKFTDDRHVMYNHLMELAQNPEVQKRFPNGSNMLTILASFLADVSADVQDVLAGDIPIKSDHEFDAAMVLALKDIFNHTLKLYVAPQEMKKEWEDMCKASMACGPHGKPLN
jgi:hypothetical protein